jgi:E3 ubiquitin-protein ligase UBR1
MSRTVAYALEFVLHTLEFSPDDTFVPETEQALGEQLTADPNPKDMFATIVWNDEKHSFDEVARHLCDTLGKSAEDAANIVDTVDEQGRDVVDISPLNSRVLENAKAIAHIDIGVTVRGAYDTFQEQLSDVIIEWMLDLSKCRIGTDRTLLREVIAMELFSLRKRDTTATMTTGYATDNDGFPSEVENPTRIDWLFILHSRLWKRPRLNLKELYVSVLTLSSAHRLTVGTCSVLQFSLY